MTDSTADLPTLLGLASTGTTSVHAAWLDGRPTLCDRTAVRWLPGRARAAVTCRSCRSRYERMRWGANDWAPPISVTEMVDAGYLITGQEN
ncbi:hypothetical protein ACGFIW_01520 [Micromonospora sp. NPDC048935]|uniref:hypothetical protein n=1 Tax=Micromonospora sp. NPDC048935 TaxID=3364262 RepID=UPI00371ACCAA